MDAEEDKSKLEDEVGEFLRLSRRVGQDQSTLTFWNLNKKNLPNLFELAMRLICIPISSADVERFFSVSGYVCSGRAVNVNEDTLIARSLLKANLKIIEKFDQD